MERIATNGQPIVDKNPRKVPGASPYVLPGLIAPETIRKDEPKPDVKKNPLPSPYVAPGLRK